MIEMRCPDCGAFVHLHASRAGQRVACPECGARFTASPGARDDVIDVEAEVIGGEPEPPEPPPHVRPMPPWAGPEPEPGQKPRVYTWQVEQRGSGGSGCCFMGCLLLAVLIALAVQGVFSLLGD